MLNKIVDLGHSAVKDRHFIAMVVHVQDKVLPHYGEANQSNVTTFGLHRFFYSTQIKSAILSRIFQQWMLHADCGLAPPH
jgi:hypothetical protein